MADILEVVLKVLIVIFMVGNMAGMGTQLAVAGALAAIRNVPRPNGVGREFILHRK